MAKARSVGVGFQPFSWGRAFVVGNAAIDDQHRHLLDMINAFGERFADGEVMDAEVRELLAELLDYTEHHFACEEAIMRDCAVDRRHQAYHLEEHHRLAQDVILIRESLDSPAALSPDKIFVFLANWLGFHVLGIDQALARQMRDIHAGMSPAEAFERERDRDAGAMQPLLDAVTGLLAVVRERNQQLHAFNASLEQTVAERTRELRELSERMEELATHDQLTGLPNRRRALQVLDTLWAAGMPLSVFMIDCDHFKAVNDRFGHAAGDELLRYIAAELSRSLRTDDIVARLGGDEFLVICPSTHLPDALSVAETIRQRISGHEVAVGEGRWVGSLSVGVAERDVLMSNPTALLRAADDGLYAAKEAGRDAVRSGELPSTGDSEAAEPVIRASRASLESEAS